MTNVNYPLECPYGKHSTNNDFLNLFYVKDHLPEHLKPYQQHLFKFCDWVCNFLSKSNDDLGREGPVCPYTQKALLLKNFWINIQVQKQFFVDEMTNVIYGFKEKFLELNRNNQSNIIFNTVVILFPLLQPDNYILIDKIQSKLKSEFVRQGLMIGQFYPGCDFPGLHNKNFHPLDAPIPMLAIRNMVRSDKVFLVESLEWEIEYEKLFGIKQL